MTDVRVVNDGYKLPVMTAILISYSNPLKL